MTGDIERQVATAVAAAGRRGPLAANAADMARAALRACRAVRRVQANRDRNAGADLGGEAGDYAVDRFEAP